MAANQAGGSAPPAQEYTVRLPRTEQLRKFSILKFNTSNNVDFTKCDKVHMERENNLREFKKSHDMDTMPKSGAGSEFGRDAKEEARRKKYGIMTKRYNPDAQPWLLKLNKDKDTRKFKGVKEGGVLDNASYYIFTQCTDGAFEAHPVEEWYNFTPQIRYKYLNSDEAEEEYTRRDKTMNLFSIMLKKRLTGTEGEADDDELDGKPSKSKGKSSSRDKLVLTEMDDWADITDDEDDDSENEEKPQKPKKKIPDKVKKSKSHKKNSDDEAVEDSDSHDEGREVDYMTDSDSEDEDMYNQDNRDKQEKYNDTGVEDVECLKKLINSEDEEEEEAKPEEEEEEKEGSEKKEKKGSDSESSSSSDSESDPEKETNFASALFMQKKGSSKKERPSSRASNKSDGSGSRSATPTIGSEADKSKASSGVKRKLEDSPSAGSSAAKVARTDTPTPGGLAAGSGSDTIEDMLRRYLMRKPTTIKDLLQKLKSKNTGMSKEKLMTTITQVLKKLNPEKAKIKGTLYLFIKKDDK